MDGKEKVLELFRSWDRDKDGTISISELRAVLGRLGLSEDEIAELFDIADTNSDGVLQYEEFAAFVFENDDMFDMLPNYDLTSRSPLLVTLSDEEKAVLKLATKDLHEKFSELTEQLGGGPNLQEAINALCLMMLDIDYTKRPNTKKRRECFNMGETIDPWTGDMNKLMRYLKHLEDNIEGWGSLLCSNVTRLLVRDCVSLASDNYKDPLTTRICRYWHHFAWEACPEMKDKLLSCETSEWLKCDGHEGSDAVRYNPKEFRDFEPSTFTGFQFKSPSSCVNKMYCRPDCAVDNLYTDTCRSRLTVESEEELVRLFAMFKGSCYFPEDQWKSEDLFRTHMDLVKKMTNNDPGVQKFYFRRDDKFPHCDMGPMPGTNLIIMKAYWNGICRALKKNIVFNVIYYIQCPDVMQSVEGFTIWVNEMQIGTQEAFDEINRRHHEYDRTRVLSKNKMMMCFYEAAMAKGPTDFGALTLDPEEQKTFASHYQAFRELSIVVDESGLRFDKDDNEDRSQAYSVRTADDHENRPDKMLFNYSGMYLQGNISLIVWQWPPLGATDVSKLRYVKSAKIWAKDQGFGSSEGRACLWGLSGDFAHPLVPNADIGHDAAEIHLTRDYKSVDKDQVIGDLSRWDSVVLGLRCCPYQGHEIHACGFEVEYILDD